MAISGVLIMSPSYADGYFPDRVTFLLGSKHVNMDESISENGEGFNEKNPGVFLTWEDRFLGLSYSLGTYKNSFNEVSAAASAAYMLTFSDNLEIGLFMGVADYHDNAKHILGDSNAKGLVPIAGLRIHYKNILVQVLPGEDDAPGFGYIVAAGVTFKLGSK